MTFFLHPRTNRWLVLMLVLAWVGALASADAVLTPVMHCRDMPCCPRSDGGMHGCSTAQCAEQVPEKAESQSVAKEPGRAFLSATLQSRDVTTPGSAVLRRELAPGLGYSVAVFRLKDDLRI